MSKKERKKLTQIIVAAVLFAAGMIISKTQTSDITHIISIVLFLAAYAITGYRVFIKAGKSISHGRAFDENFLMAIATIGALCLQDWAEATAVMLFYNIGELFEDFAVGKSRKSVSDLMDIRPDYATLLGEDGSEQQVDPYEVNVGDHIIVKPGERVPLDGIVISGTATLDTSALTGESLPRDISEGDDIVSGSINLSGVLIVKVTALFENSTVSRILDLIENSGSKKAQIEKFITRFARWYTPIVVICAIVLALVPPIFVPGQVFSDWVYRALMFLVISCPCALVISIPLSFFGGIGAAGKSGILIKSGNYLEVLAKLKTIVFDKTGTITTGSFSVLQANGPSDLAEIAALAELHSAHPIALSIKEFAGDIDEASSRVQLLKEDAGHGVHALVDGKDVCVGNAKMMAALGLSEELSALYECELATTIVYVAVEGKYYGSLYIADSIKEDAPAAMDELRALGITDLAMLTGDRDAIAKKIAEHLKLSTYAADLLPTEKVDKLEEIMAATACGCQKLDDTLAGSCGVCTCEANGSNLLSMYLTKRINNASIGKVAFVGDGLNDAPSLARADLGIAMGAMGTQAAIEAADVVIMDDRPSLIPLAITIAKRTVSIARQNIVISLVIKIAVLVLAACGIGTMWLAIFADVGVCVIAILNAMRTLLLK